MRATVEELKIRDENKVNASLNELDLVTLDKNAVAFVQGELNSGSSLAKICLQDSLFDNSLVQAYLPKYIDLANLGDLHHSIALETGIKLGENAEQKTADFILEYLAKAESHLFVVETYYGYPENKSFLESESIPYFVFNNEVYFYLSGIRYDRNILTSILHSARDYPFISYLASFTELIPFQVDTGFVKSLVENTSVAIIGAFDAEGYYLICERSKKKIVQHSKAA